MEKFLSLIREIPDATSLLTPNANLANQSLKVMELLTDDLHQYLLTDNFDEEQIWGQLSLITKKLLSNLEEQSKLQVYPHKSKRNQNRSDDASSREEDISLEENYSEDENEINEDNSENSKENQDLSEDVSENASGEAKALQEAPDFFDPEEMVRFADEAVLEKEDPAFSGSESKDLAEDSSESAEKTAKYGDFFEDPGHVSSEEEQEKLFSMVDEDEMDRLEQKLISEKPWQLKGEVQSKNRPRDSLLDEELDFELARNPVPQTQTKVVTDEIENIIKQRILDMVYDDVKPKRALDKLNTKTAPQDFMDYEKSKKSLAELYEEDFKREVLHIPINTELERAKKEITVVFRKLCYNLDLMSSLHPVAKPVVRDIEVKRSDTPALVMEEILPFGINKEVLSNPTEVFDPKNTNLKAKEEMTKSDKNNLRKRHKATLRTRRKERIMKIMNKIAQDPKAQKFEYRKMVKEEKARKELIERKKQPKTKFTRSSEFFKNFQELNKEINTKVIKETKEAKEPQTIKKIKL